MINLWMIMTEPIKVARLKEDTYTYQGRWLEIPEDLAELSDLERVMLAEETYGKKDPIAVMWLITALENRERCNFGGGPGSGLECFYLYTGEPIQDSTFRILRQMGYEIELISKNVFEQEFSCPFQYAPLA